MPGQLTAELPTGVSEKPAAPQSTEKAPQPVGASEAKMVEVIDSLGDGHSPDPDKSLKAILDLPTKEPAEPISESPEIKTESPETTAAQPKVPENKTAAVLLENLKTAGIDAKVATVSGNQYLTEVIILPKKESPTEKMVRVYRGVSQKDATILNQTPYALRSSPDANDLESPIFLEDVRQEVTALAHEPTYKHLLEYTAKTRPLLTDEEKQVLDNELRKCEDAILEGFSLRSQLMIEQISHHGGLTADRAIAPYISASHDPREALGYSTLDGSMLVIDLPRGELEDQFGTGTETAIKEVLDPKYITAIIPNNRSRPVNGIDNIDQEMSRAFAVITEQSAIINFSTQELAEARKSEALNSGNKDRVQGPIDLEQVRVKRTGDLITNFPEIGTDLSQIEQRALDAGIDIYRQMKLDVFDYYVDRYSTATQGKRTIQSLSYRPTTWPIEAKYDRETITDEMLEKLRTQVQHTEEREARFAQK